MSNQTEPGSSLSERAQLPLILIGGGGHCRSCIDVIESQGVFSIAGIIDSPAMVGKSVLRYEVIGTDDDLELMASQAAYFLITVGFLGTSSRRAELYQKMTDLGLIGAIVVSPKSYVSNYAAVGAGTVVMHGATVNAGSRIGTNTIINSHALVEHDCAIGSSSHLATGAVVNGNCKVGQEVLLGSRSVLVQGTEICNNVIVGAGATVTHSISIPGTYVGTPARRISNRSCER